MQGGSASPGTCHRGPEQGVCVGQEAGAWGSALPLPAGGAGVSILLRHPGGPQACEGGCTGLLSVPASFPMFCGKICHCALHTVGAQSMTPTAG